MINSSNHIPAKGKEPNHPPQLQQISVAHTDGPLLPAEHVHLMDVRDVAEYLNLDRQTIYNWLHQQKISGIKVGGVWRFDRRVIDEWLQSHTVGVTPMNTHKRKPHEFSPEA